MNAIADARSVLLEPSGEVADRMLRLRHGHSISGDDGDTAGCLQNEGGFIGGSALDAPLIDIIVRRPDGVTQISRQYVPERPVHGAAHDFSEDEPRGADERSADDQNVVAEHETR